MIIQQLSIFLQNKLGRFTEVTNILGKAGVNMEAFTVSENSDFGMVRLIVDDTARAAEALRAANFAVNIIDVVCLECDDTPGSIAPFMNILSKEGVSIEYMYAFSMGNRSRIVIRTDELERCDRLISK